MRNTKIIKKTSTFFLLIFFSFLITCNYHFDHYAFGSALIKYNYEIYSDKTNLYFLINNSSPSFLFIIISFLVKTGFTVNFINTFLTFIPTLLNLSGIYLVSRFITSSIFLSFLIAITAVVLKKNFGDIDYPTLMFTEHTNGLVAYSLSTFILGLLTIRNLSFSIIFCLLLLSIHLIIGVWMLGLIILTFFLNFKKNNSKKNLLIVPVILLIALFYFNSQINYTETSFEFNQKDYSDYFYYIEAHRTNYGDLKNFHYSYVIKSFILLILIFFYLKDNSSNFSNNNNIFFKTLSLSIIFSSIIYFTYKFFPQFFPEIIIRTIPQRFFLIHSVIGYPIIISIFYNCIKKFCIYKKFKSNFSLQLVTVILILHLLQHNEIFIKGFKNIEIIKENKKTEKLFWQNVNDLKLNGYILTSNYLCNKTIIYTKHPILFCFESLDYIPYLPKFVSPSKELIKKILGISYSDVKYRNLGGISELEIKEVYENKKINEWKIIKDEFNVNTLIVPKEWNLKLDNLLLDSKYKVYKID